MEIIKFKKGDKVFTADGRVGMIGEDGDVLFKDGGSRVICKSDYDDGFADFYMIGKNLFGNKIPVEEMERRIAEQREIVKTETEKLDTLRKQLWTMNERMVPDWKERLEAKKAEQTPKE